MNIFGFGTNLLKGQNSLYRYTGLYIAIFLCLQLLVDFSICMRSILCYYSGCGKLANVDHLMYSFYIVYFYDEKPTLPIVCTPLVLHIILWIYIFVSFFVLLASLYIIHVFKNWKVRNNIWIAEKLWIIAMIVKCSLDFLIVLLFILDIVFIYNLNSKSCFVNKSESNDIYQKSSNYFITEYRDNETSNVQKEIMILNDDDTNSMKSIWKRLANTMYVNKNIYDNTLKHNNPVLNKLKKKFKQDLDAKNFMHHSSPERLKFYKMGIKSKKIVHKVEIINNNFTMIVCAGDTAIIECDPKSKQYILFFNSTYGRSNGITCAQGNTFNEVCGHDVTDDIRNLCPSNNRCVLPTSKFQSNCIHLPYLTVRYQCSTGKQIIHWKTCSIVKMSCSQPDQYIRVTYAAFGRFSDACCKQDSDEQGCKNRNCYHPDAFGLIKKFCYGKHYCEFHVKDDWLGDPCPKSKKQLHYSYTCTYYEPNSAVIRELCNYCKTWLYIPTILFIVFFLKGGVIWFLNIVATYSLWYLGKTSRKYPTLMLTPNL